MGDDSPFPFFFDHPSEETPLPIGIGVGQRACLPDKPKPIEFLRNCFLPRSLTEQGFPFFYRFATFPRA
jgi:hypothetical protein